MKNKLQHCFVCNKTAPYENKIIASSKTQKNVVYHFCNLHEVEAKKFIEWWKTSSWVR